MNDASIRNHIEALVAEEKTLHEREQTDAEQPAQEPLEADRERLAQISLELDQCWDLLRQRRARRDAGEDPDEARARDVNTFEKDLQ
jgi:Protein of unknown function (DUF2630)